MKKKTAILYICTGKYIIFLSGFYKSAEKHLFREHDITYFVFTDAPVPQHLKEKINIQYIYQERLGWPYDTLKRFDIFYKIKEILSEFDYIYFFNANLVINSPIGNEILPENNEQIVVCLHPGYFNKPRRKFTYEDNPSSKAYIPDNNGEHYFAGGLNGGTSLSYLTLISDLKAAIEIDETNGIIAKWHDESHLNRYAIDHKSVKILSPAYLYPEGAKLPFKKIITILDKKKFGGHEFLRNKPNSTKSIKSFARKTLYKMRSIFRNTIINRVNIY